MTDYGLSPATAMSEPRRGLLAGASIGAWITLALLVFIGLYMYADRHVVTLQTDAIKASLGLSDFEIGLVQGLSLALCAAIVGYPVAWLADRFDRRAILAASVLVWCVAVAGCGLARDFNQLFVTSALVGAGEAGLLPITYALIPELFQGRSRVLANSAIIVIGRIGSGIIIALTGLLIQQAGTAHAWLPSGLAAMEPWRLTFLAIALPGPLFAAATVAMRIRPDVDAREAARAAAEATRAISVWPFLSRNLGTFVPFYLSVGLLVFGMSAIGAFLPVVAMRQMGASAALVGGWMGSATMISTLAAMAVIVGGASQFQRWLGERYTIWLLAVAALAPALIALGFLFVRTTPQLFALLGVVFLFLSAGSMAFPTAIQELTPRATRARLVSITIMLNIILSAMAPAVVGAVSDRLRGRPNGLMIATVATAVAGLLLSALLLLIAARRYAATVRDARAEDDRL